MQPKLGQLWKQNDFITKQYIINIGYIYFIDEDTVRLQDLQSDIVNTIVIKTLLHDYTKVADPEPIKISALKVGTRICVQLKDKRYITEVAQ